MTLGWLFLVLRDGIARGALAEGDPLPTEQSLGAQFGVSRITVRRALADLAERGYIERRRGVGSFVRQHDQGNVPEVGVSYVDGIKQIQFETDTEVIEFDNSRPPPSVSRRLEISGPALHVLRLRRERRTAEPLMITEAWLPTALSAVATRSALAGSALYDLLSASGVLIDKVDHEMTAEAAGPATARLLDIPIGSAVMRVNRVAYVNGAPHHFLSILSSPNRSRVVVSQTTTEPHLGHGVAIMHDVGRAAW